MTQRWSRVKTARGGIAAELVGTLWLGESEVEGWGWGGGWCGNRWWKIKGEDNAGEGVAAQL